LGLTVIIHNDVDVPLPNRTQTQPTWLRCRRCSNAIPEQSIIWAHTGVGRSDPSYCEPRRDARFDAITDPEFNHVYFDISWDELAKYVTASPESLKISADLFNRFPDRFLFGTDALAPKDTKAYFDTYNDYGPAVASAHEGNKPQNPQRKLQTHFR